jgi:hypothetical protein
MKKHIPLLAVLILTLAWVSAAATPLSCNSNYDSVTSLLNSAPIGVGNRTKIISHINNAWRIYSSGKKNSQKNALKELDQAIQLLASNATKQIPLQTRNSLIQAIQSMRSCLAGTPAPDTATLSVRTFLPSDVSTNGIAGPGPAGVVIFIDDSEFGTTSADGTVTLQVPARTLQVEARLYPSNSGQAVVTLAPNETKQVDIILDDGKELAENSTLEVDQLVDGILDRNFTALTLRFTKDDGTTAAIKSVDLVALLDAQGGASTFVTQMFTLQPDGTLTLNNVASFRNLLLLQAGKILLNVHAEDTNGRVHDRTAEFFVSAYKILGHLSAPPSSPGLNTTGIFITGKILNTNLVFNVVSDASGNFEFPLLPSGNFEFSSETFQNGLYYYGQGILVLNGNKSLNVNMLGTVDLVNGVLPFTVTPLATPVTLAANAKGEATLNNKVVAPETSPEIDPAELQGREALASKKILLTNSFTPGAVTALADPTTVSVNVTAGQQNTPITQTTTLNVPQGTKTVNLTYTVQTDEYPTYVLAQSIYNDTWSVAVRAGTTGQQLFNIGRQVNSQLTVAPVWQSNGTTGAIKQTINVESLTVNGAASLVLFASAMNVGDSILPTRVNATLGPDASVRINTATPDSSVPLNFHSIPRPGETNTFDRYFTLDISKPDMSTVKRVIVTLLGPGQLMTVVDEPVGSGSVEEIDAHTLRVRVSIKAVSSTVASQPPPAHQLKYRFKLVVDVNGTEVSDEKESGERRGLWRMPDGFARYSTRDTGGDDWCSRGTYNWLAANSSLITKINDISGEHGRNIGHQTHKYGTDIDMFHLYTFPGAVSGGDNYQKLVADVKLAINTGSSDPIVAAQATAAKQRVKAWVIATHTGLDALAASPTVIELRYALGAAATGLSSGWARDLLNTGKTTVSGQTLDLGTGTWNNSKYIPVNDHNDHIHITLSRPALGESN